MILGDRDDRTAAMTGALPTLRAGPCSTRIARISRSSHLPEPNNQENESEHNAASQHRQIARGQSIANRPCKPGPGLPSLDAMDDSSRNNEGDESMEEKQRLGMAPVQTA